MAVADPRQRGVFAAAWAGVRRPRPAARGGVAAPYRPGHARRGSPATGVTACSAIFHAVAALSGRRRSARARWPGVAAGRRASAPRPWTPCWPTGPDRRRVSRCRGAATAILDATTAPSPRDRLAGPGGADPRPRVALGPTPWPSVEATRLRGVLIGCGFFAQNHLHGWAEAAGASIVAVCDADRARAEATAARFGVARGLRRRRRDAGGGAPDFVDVATTVATHRALVELAVRHGGLVSARSPSPTPMPTGSRWSRRPRRRARP